MTSEQQARETIDALLTRAGWVVRNADEVNIHACRGVAIRDKSAGEPIWTPAGRPKGRGTGMDRDQSPLKQGHGFADYLLYVDGQAAGVIEAKKEGATLSGVEIQSGKYTADLPDGLPAWSKPLPFSYQSAGTDKSVGKPIWTPARRPKGSGSGKSRYQTRFTNGLDPEPRFRP